MQVLPQCMQAVEDALGAGVDRFDTGDRERVRSTQEALRLEEALAKEVLNRVARKAFLGFLSRARNKKGGQGQGQHAGAKELESLVYFSNLCVAPLLDDLKVGHACTNWPYEQPRPDQEQDNVCPWAAHELRSRSCQQVCHCPAWAVHGSESPGAGSICRRVRRRRPARAWPT